MNIHEDFIKKANKEIEKLTADIEKKKARISELKADIKKHEAEKARDNDFSADLIKLLNDNGVTSDEERKAMLSKIEEIMIEMEMKKTETQAEEETQPQTESTVSDNEPAVNNEEKTNSATSSVYQNTQYPYRPTGNINQ